MSYQKSHTERPVRVTSALQSNQAMGAYVLVLLSLKFLIQRIKLGTQRNTEWVSWRTRDAWRRCLLSLAQAGEVCLTHTTTLTKELILLCAGELWLSHSSVTWGHPVFCRNRSPGRVRLQSIWCPVLPLLLSVSHISLKKYQAHSRAKQPQAFFCSVQRAMLRIYSSLHPCGSPTRLLTWLEQSQSAPCTLCSSRPTGGYSTYVRA